MIYAREGVDLDRSLLAKWVGHSAALVQTRVDVLRRQGMASTQLYCKDTPVPVPVLAPGNGKTRAGRRREYVRDDRASGDIALPAVCVAIAQDRMGIRPPQNLESFNGTLQVDT